MSRRAILILVAILILAAVGAAGAYWYFTKTEPNVCTQEAMLCPDGSYVGRTGPNCEFAVCPSPQSSDGQFCIQVITPAKNPATGECREFPTPCDVPENWEQVESCETSVLDTLNWKTYRNEGYGFEFKYPNDWPLPIKLKGSEYNNGGFRVATNSLWKLNVGPIAKGECEGVDCYVYGVEGFIAVNPDEVIQKLEADKSVNIENNNNIINGVRSVMYSESEICGNKNVFIFGEKYTINFSSKCGDDNLNRATIFNQILFTFKFIK